MEFLTLTSNIEPDVLRDAQIVAECVAARKSVPEDVAARVRKRADETRAETLAMHGVQDIGVQIIRELRGELPQ